MTAPLASSWLTLTSSAATFLPGRPLIPVSFRAVLEGCLTDTRKPQGKRHPLPSLISVLVTGVAAACTGPLAVAQAARGWSQEVLAAHGCRVSPRTGLRVPPSASMLDRLGKLLDADELEAALTGAVAALALDPAIPAAYAAHRAEQRREQQERQKKRKPPAAEAFREDRQDRLRLQLHPLHPWLDPAVTGDPGHVPARRAVAVDGKERKGAKAGGNKKVHLLAAVTHVPGIVIAQDKVAKTGKANEISHFRPLLAPLPARRRRRHEQRDAGEQGERALPAEGQERPLPVAGPGQPAVAEPALNGLPWESAPVAAATSEIRRGRIETRTVRALPAPDGTGFQDAEPALLIERYTTYKKKGRWHTRCEAVLYITSLAADEATPEDLLAHVRGHWRVEHTHWLRDVIWKEDKSLIRTGNGPQIWSALANLVITLFRIHGVTTEVSHF